MLENLSVCGAIEQIIKIKMDEPTLNNKDIKDESDNRKAFTYVTHFDSKGMWNYKPTEHIMAEYKGISGERERTESSVRVYFG